MSRRYTLMMVPDRSSKVRRVRVSKSTLWFFLSICMLVVAVIGVGVFHYLTVIDQVGENWDLKQQNLQLRHRLVSLHEKVASIENVLDRVQRFDTKLRTITQLNDPKRHLALGPVDIRSGSDYQADGSESVAPLVRAIGENPHLAISLLGKQLDEMASEAEKREGSIRQLETYLRGQKARLASTPSVWPARGWVTSGFGMRPDPYTGKRVMHRGLDIANQEGVPIVSPARGVVTFKGISGGYGKLLIIDHGYEIRTRYGHLNEFKVSVGDHVERGEIIGNIGNSGRSTGPHLHYEVEVNGVCENPKSFILED